MQLLITVLQVIKFMQFLRIRRIEIYHIIFEIRNFTEAEIIGQQKPQGRTFSEKPIVRDITQFLHYLMRMVRLT